ncbi:MAG: hypothetical protein WCO56_20665 [Verrucomicrobiota bacterium]
MNETRADHSASSGGPHTSSGTGFSGEVVYIYAFDLAYDMTSLTQHTLLGQPLAEFYVDSDKRNPRHLLLHRPRMARLPLLERIGPHGVVRIERTIKLLPVGAISITVRVPFQVQRLEDLVAYHDLRFDNGDLYSEVRQLAEAVRLELHPMLIRPVATMAEEEAYTVFCIKAPLRGDDGRPLNAEQWFLQHRRLVASLLTQESNPQDLSRQEAEESTGRFLSYYENDLVVLDWDAALIVDEPRDIDETLYLLELANFQLAELEAYDRLLDEVLERSYRDMTGRSERNRRLVMKDLREIRVDLARLSDELSNITKFFGDWHLARIYAAISDRFHLADWHHTIDEKLKTLDELYQLLSQEHNNRLMLILEVAIVVLFVIDIIKLLFY